MSRRFMPFPQPAGLAPALLEAQLWVLGKMLAVVGPHDQLAILEVGAAVSGSRHEPCGLRVLDWLWAGSVCKPTRHRMHQMLQPVHCQHVAMLGQVSRLQVSMINHGCMFALLNSQAASVIADACDCASRTRGNMKHRIADA